MSKNVRIACRGINLKTGDFLVVNYLGKLRLVQYPSNFEGEEEVINSFISKSLYKINGFKVRYKEKQQDNVRWYDVKQNKLSKQYELIPYEFVKVSSTFLFALKSLFSLLSIGISGIVLSIKKRSKLKELNIYIGEFIDRLRAKEFCYEFGKFAKEKLKDKENVESAAYLLSKHSSFKNVYSKLKLLKEIGNSLGINSYEELNAFKNLENKNKNIDYLFNFFGVKNFNEVIKKINEYKSLEDNFKFLKEDYERLKNFEKEVNSSIGSKEL